MRIAICDDDPAAVQQLCAHLTAYWQAAGLPESRPRVFTSSRALLASDGDFDLLFLDIRMAQPDGLQAARLLRQKGWRCRLVFVSALREYVFDAFAVEASDYLLKPLDAAGFRQTMDRVCRTLREQEPLPAPSKSLVVRHGSGCTVIPFAEIVYCEVQGRKVSIHRQDGALTVYCQKLTDLAQQLDGRFFRCHRSYLVNLAHVRGSAAGQVLLTQGQAIPLSRLREKELTQALLRYMKEA